MLTKEILKASSVLAALTDEQLQSIVELSKNDETAVISQKVGEIHRQYDDTILKATGIPRNGDEKSYVYLERAGKALKEQATGASKELNDKIAELSAEKERLEKAIKENGSDTELKTQLSNAQAELTQTKKQYTDLQKKLNDTTAEHSNKLHEMQVDFELNGATQGLKFKAELPESATKVLLQQALGSIKSNKADFIDDGNGGKRLVFRNAEGAILNNPENQLNPFTAAELLKKELATMGVLDDGRKQAGAGSGSGGSGSGGSGQGFDLSGAKNKIEANEIITKQLLSQGMTRGSKEFEEATTQAWKDNGVADLPEN